MALYNPAVEKDNCGFGLIAHMKGVASHKLVRTAISSLARMAHRGGIGADGKTGDGCGLLLQKPDSFFKAVARENGWNIGARYGVGMIFLSPDRQLAASAKDRVAAELENESLTLLGWRDVPVNKDVLGKFAEKTMPRIAQVVFNGPFGWGSRDLERRLYIAKRKIEKSIDDDPDFYIASLSNLVIVYKGLCRPADLPLFFPDLADIRMQSAICLFHQRFSTNTLPKWSLAQPFRFLAHNGEINTITGNRQWAKSRSYKFRSPLLPDMAEAAPFVNETGSDSSALDNMLELLLAGGMDLFRAFRLLIPPAWQNHPNMDADLKAFYDFNSMHMEPWDGPAGIVMSDGRFAACGLDRNGLRPARYVVTSDNLMTLASEVGIWDYQPDEVVEKGRVGPGELLVIDTLTGKRWSSWDIDRELKSRHPYREWMEKCCYLLPRFDQEASKECGGRELDRDRLLLYQKVFGVTSEEIREVIQVLGQTGQEPVSSMGDDAPMAVLSTTARSLYDYFRQMFAQVTNPPIDPLRERHVMSLATCIGREQNVFDEVRGHAHRVMFLSPVLVYSDFRRLLGLDQDHYKHVVLDLNYPADGSLRTWLEKLLRRAKQEVKNGAVLLVLSDRNIAPDTLPIPAPVAVGALQKMLVENAMRCDTNIIVETASVRDSHHFAVLLGMGATAIYPYLVYETLGNLVEEKMVQTTLKEAICNYRQGVDKGLLKIFSKMGISTISSYRCSQLFEVVGLGREVTDCFLGNMASRIGGAGFDDIQKDQQMLADYGWKKKHKPLIRGGLFKYIYGGEYHAYNPDVVTALQKAVRTGSYDDYQQYASLVDNRPVACLRDLLAIRTTEKAVDIDEVEAAENFYQRFDSAAMSIGALSQQAHEALAIGMNRLGGFSNSGEGGEDPERFGTERVSRIKQVASGRFGVTPHYLVNADVIQIKMAQGAKPGEGGQLPGHKVTAQIAELRYSTPGVTLISPPPHHDIYSIEDLAQLIFDLKQVNPDARISVKLVSEPGVGTIATGVAKAYADLITISGYDGGTGASPLTSVKYAGSPWELGLVETQQALVANGLRHKVRLQVDGGLKTGMDIVKAAILGAESFGFGTGPLIALGCKFLRICHLNNCATGVATQDETLRKEYFGGVPEMVMNYFRFVVQQTRMIMAELGVTRLTDLIGRTDLLAELTGSTARQHKLDLAPLLESAAAVPGSALYFQEDNVPDDQGALNLQLGERFGPAVEAGTAATGTFSISNTDRSVGALLSGRIARRYGNKGMADHPLTLFFNGTAGQSFGAWNVGGLEMILTGDANDYVGKGMAGGKLVIRPPVGVNYKSHEAVIIGNTCLYGATGGTLFGAGTAGERFAVRNSGAKAVVEGLGDNGCEYMTGGIVTVLGETGVNFGAGMTGGFAYVLDESGAFASRVNQELVEVLELGNRAVLREHLRAIVNRHFEETGSLRAERILAGFDEHFAELFKLVKPRTTDVESLLGRRGNSPKETLAVVF
ncbi:glutamate synthase large subunit [Desulforhopalus singaporensis]|uniref:Glutamate synthase [NADPH] large chain n=1 Tax=Desulforhopalus singaporensis TaxID=91360 RepID=A0A1H0K273_9BACT|nr:glutamate synthase large subunit [Desulforhopalus singaporensis]SDO49842.1 glutamate synthase (NADPH/NADH) large chain [Desulforhopalus singaporensis]